MLSCLCKDPAQRPTAGQLLQRLSQLADAPTSPRSGPASDGGGEMNGSPSTRRMRVLVPQTSLRSPFASDDTP